MIDGIQRVDGSVPDEKSTIQPIDTPFLKSRGKQCSTQPYDDGTNYGCLHLVAPLNPTPSSTPGHETDDWMQPGKGISMCSNGEPKSGTTWTEGVITEIAVRLCGSPLNPW